MADVLLVAGAVLVAAGVFLFDYRAGLVVVGVAAIRFAFRLDRLDRAEKV